MTLPNLVVRTFGVGAYVLVIVACGPGQASTPPSARILKACDALCEKAKDCKGALDIERCKSRCSTTDSMRKVEAFRPEAGDAMLACVTANVCEPEREAADKRCAHEVAQKLPVSPKVKALCAKLEDAFASCSTRWVTPCTEELRFFADQDLDGFGECVDRSCRGGANCFREAEHAILTKAH